MEEATKGRDLTDAAPPLGQNGSRPKRGRKPYFRCQRSEYPLSLSSWVQHQKTSRDATVANGYCPPISSALHSYGKTRRKAFILFITQQTRNEKERRSPCRRRLPQILIQSLWRSLRELHFWSANKLAPPLLLPLSPFFYSFILLYPQ